MFLALAYYSINYSNDAKNIPSQQRWWSNIFFSLSQNSFCFCSGQTNNISFQFSGSGGFEDFSAEKRPCYSTKEKCYLVVEAIFPFYRIWFWLKNVAFIWFDRLINWAPDFQLFLFLPRQEKLSYFSYFTDKSFLHLFCNFEFSFFPCISHFILLLFYWIFTNGQKIFNFVLYSFSALSINRENWAVFEWIKNEINKIQLKFCNIFHSNCCHSVWSYFFLLGQIIYWFCRQNKIDFHSQ